MLKKSMLIDELNDEKSSQVTSRSFLNPSLVNVTNVRDTKLILFEIKSIN